MATAGNCNLNACMSSKDSPSWNRRSNKTRCGLYSATAGGVEARLSASPQQARSFWRLISAMSSARTNELSSATRIFALFMGPSINGLAELKPAWRGGFAVTGSPIRLRRLRDLGTGLDEEVTLN